MPYRLAIHSAIYKTQLRHSICYLWEYYWNLA